MAFVRTGGQTTAKANFRDFFRLGVDTRSTRTERSACRMIRTPRSRSTFRLKTP